VLRSSCVELLRLVLLSVCVSALVCVSTCVRVCVYARARTSTHGTAHCMRSVIQSNPPISIQLVSFLRNVEKET